ncbi:MAG: DNA (cytosine-5-)-methyltransferase [Rhizobiales bacterium]|nr:DNA (cytosine-5-)-methyltransferase [Hyphomicrobiales bacterium]OJY43453.1 MAG: DNA (cytosine-5-)-methyltransferase [Rhizobiales bacterium 64-17]
MIRTLDIFCGGGGSSYGARQAGAEIVCGIDLCDVATETYRENFKEAHVVTARLEDVGPRALHNKIGNIDLLLASPECTNHTCAKGAAPRSEASRATAMQALRYAKEFRPRWLVMENVVHMRPWSRYGELKEALQDLGYNVREFVFDASDFGVPQSRRRLFVVCDLEDEVADIKIPRIRKKKTVHDILDKPGTWDTTPLFRPGRAKPTLERAERGFAKVGKKAAFLLVYYGSDGSGGWQPLDRPLRTITTVDRFALVEPGAGGHNMRMLQVSELKKAMGFKSDYIMNHGSRRENIKILGNGVCPPVMQAIVECIGSA